MSVFPHSVHSKSGSWSPSRCAKGFLNPGTSNSQSVHNRQNSVNHYWGSEQIRPSCVLEFGYVSLLCSIHSLV
uniref:Uncharacterized protein n=1 Tax=Anguilla anguilla TaxID=7936 RepID=A0A0E9WSA8_ANGAN